MSEKTKKIIIIILFILVIIAIAFLLYLVFFKKVVPPEKIVSEESKEIKKEQPVHLPVTKQEWEKMTVEERLKRELPAFEWPKKEEKKITQAERIIPEIDDVAQGGRTWIYPVSDTSAQDAVLAADGKNSLYYDSESGHFYSIDNLGNKELLSDQVFYNVEKINWAPTKDKAILEYPDGFKVMYDFKANKQYTLPKNWQEFSWNSSGTKIVFKTISKYAENNWLAAAKPDGGQLTPLEHMGDNADKVVVSWSPNDQVVAFSSTGEPRGTWEQEILLIGQYQQNFKSIVVDGRGFEPKWSPKGDKIIYSVYSAESGYKPHLYIVDAQGEYVGKNKKDLGLATWAHKCVFSKIERVLYCAVPQDLPEGAGLVTELARNTRDNFYKIDLETGTSSFLAEGAMGGYNVDNIYLSAEEDILYFTDKNTGKLRYIRIK